MHARGDAELYRIKHGRPLSASRPTRDESHAGSASDPRAGEGRGRGDPAWHLRAD